MKRLNWIISGLAALWAVIMFVLVFFLSAMNVEAFINLVQKMRKHQRDYYRDRKMSDLLESKQLERQVDQALRDGISIPVEAVLDNREDGPDQIGLFE